MFVRHTLTLQRTCRARPMYPIFNQPWRLERVGRSSMMPSLPLSIHNILIFSSIKASLVSIASKSAHSFANMACEFAWFCCIFFVPAMLILKRLFRRPDSIDQCKVHTSTSLTHSQLSIIQARKVLASRLSTFLPGNWISYSAIQVKASSSEPSGYSGLEALFDGVVITRRGTATQFCSLSSS